MLLVAVLAIAALILVSAFGAYEYSRVAALQRQDSSLSSENAAYNSRMVSLQSENQDLGSEISGLATPTILQALLSHLSKEENDNISGALEDYVPNATMIWTGDASSLGGTYNGTTEIEEALQKWTAYPFFGQPGAAGPTSLNYTVESVHATLTSIEVASVQASIYFNGTSPSLDLFQYNGTISASYSYVNQNGSWLIREENWNFTTFNAGYLI